eukprot:m.114941 g.114941  ORF g.114941 m.114941 type:complete len:70 (+) comp9462_c0_seq2:4149-4358(+)
MCRWRSSPCTWRSAPAHCEGPSLLREPSVPMKAWPSVLLPDGSLVLVSSQYMQTSPFTCALGCKADFEF